MSGTTAPDLGFFLHALASEFDAQAGAAARDVLLRAAGRRMAARLPPPDCATLEALELELNDALRRLGWGRMRLDLVPEERALLIRHSGLPLLGALGEPHGHWLEAVLEGLYEGWLSSLPDATAAYAAVRLPPGDEDWEPGEVLLRFRAGTG